MAKTPNLDELRVQARNSYRFWHIYLMLRLREVELTTPKQRNYAPNSTRHNRRAFR